MEKQYKLISLIYKIILSIFTIFSFGRFSVKTAMLIRIVRKLVNVHKTGHHIYIMPYNRRPPRITTCISSIFITWEISNTVQGKIKCQLYSTAVV
jgi:hypothetical protein